MIPDGRRAGFTPPWRLLRQRADPLAHRIPPRRGKPRPTGKTRLSHVHAWSPMGVGRGSPRHGASIKAAGRATLYPAAPPLKPRGRPPRSPRRHRRSAWPALRRGRGGGTRMTEQNSAQRPSTGLRAPALSRGLAPRGPGSRPGGVVLGSRAALRPYVGRAGFGPPPPARTSTPPLKPRRRLRLHEGIRAAHGPRCGAGVVAERACPNRIPTQRPSSSLRARPRAGASPLGVPARGRDGLSGVPGRRSVPT
jgi:hypothetical protein